MTDDRSLVDPPLTTQERTALIISTDFPPAPVVGGLRLAKLCRHLPSFGWRTAVVTVAESARTPLREPETDILIPGMQVDLPQDACEVHAVWGPNPIRLAGSARRWLALLVERRAIRSSKQIGNPGHLTGRQWSPTTTRRGRWARTIAGAMVPDAYAAWIPSAIVTAIKLTPRLRPRIIVTSYPSASGVVAAAIVSSTTGLPFVADFRDIWMEKTPARFLGTRRQRFERRIERAVLSRASAVTAVNREMLDAELANIKAEGIRRSVIPQGWDPEEAMTPSKTTRDGTFRIVYAGTLDPHVSDPTTFLRALVHASRTTAACPRTEVTFVGQQLIDVNTLSRSVGADHVVRSVPHVGRDEALGLMTMADLLLIVLSQPGAFWTSGKVWDYFTAGRPILAVVDPQSAVARLIRETGTGWVAAPWDQRDLETCLSTILGQFSQSGRLRASPVDHTLNALTAQESARQMAELLDEVSNNPRRSRRSRLKRE